MDVRFLAAAGYQLWACVSGTEYITVPIPICEPNIDTSEEGVLHIAGEKTDITPVISTKDHKPNLKTS